VEKSGVYPRGAKGLRLPAAPDADPAVQVRIVPDPLDRPEQVLRMANLHVVDPRFEAVRGTERLAHHQIAGRQME
jgi:hypothetical protein